MGNVKFHGGGAYSDRSGAGESQSLCIGIRFVPAHISSTAVCKRPGVSSASAETGKTPVSPFGLCSGMESAGTFLGLSLPWFPVRGIGKADGQSGYGEFESPTDRLKKAHLEPGGPIFMCTAAGSLPEYPYLPGRNHNSGFRWGGSR